MQWEYREEEISTVYAAIEGGEPGQHPGGEWIWVDEPADRPFRHLLTSLGAEGWELVGFTPAIPEASSQRLHAQAIFKRPIG
jgi:hypothetical protein